MKYDNTVPARMGWAPAAVPTANQDSGQDKMKCYEKLADEIAELTRTSVLAPGQKVSLVRHASRTYGVSASTMFQAYYLLESRGPIMARIHSGHFVCQHVQRPLPEPEISPRQADAIEVDVSELVFPAPSSIGGPDTVSFGPAPPSPQLFPLPCLARSTAHAVRDMGLQPVVVDMTPGNHGLRCQIVLRYMVGGLLLPAEELVISNGALGALDLCLQAVICPGDLVVTEAPALYIILQVLERLKLKAVEIPVHPREDIDLEVLADSLEHLPTKAYWFMSNFQDPMGASTDDEKRHALAGLLACYQVPMIEDDVYVELYFDQQVPKPIKAYDQKGLVMYCSFFSKNPAPGYRADWAAGRRYAGQTERLELMTSLSASIPAQVVIADYLQRDGYDRHLRRLRYVPGTQQNAMLVAVARYFPEQTRVSRPSGDYFLRLESSEAVDSLRLFQLTLAQGINPAPEPIFFATHRFTRCTRFNYRHPWSARQEKAVGTLGRIAQSLAE